MALSWLIRLTVFLYAVSCASGWIGTSTPLAGLGYDVLMPPSVPPSLPQLQQLLESEQHVSNLSDGPMSEGVMMPSPTALFVIAIVAVYCSDLFFGESSSSTSPSSSSAYQGDHQSVGVYTPYSTGADTVLGSSTPMWQQLQQSSIRS
ncbi:hypothetical protein FOL47_010979 [Perkinsus chesapeaki]|uniref:Uncharacterized protein n=1 Tax=Perkinsus chesapeaki TaxID=330153 RepID=A0A7J6MNH9_PERCH|nr:hypothetical protein FOL47_010979 [Perkinsus chesapeaki]